MRAVDRLVAAGGPAGAAGEERGVVATADEDDAGRGLLLEVALQAEVGVAALEHLGVHGAVRVVAGDAALAGRLVLEHIRAALLDVALQAGWTSNGPLKKAAYGCCKLDPLRHYGPCRRENDRRAFAYS